MSASRKVVIGLVAVLVLVLVAATALVGVLVRRPLPEHGGTVSSRAWTPRWRCSGTSAGWRRSTRAPMPTSCARRGTSTPRIGSSRWTTVGTPPPADSPSLVGQNEAAMGADLVVRTLGWRRVAEQEWEMLGEEARDLYSAYADGVNAYLRSREASRLGLEYTVLGLTTTLAPVEPWDPVDSLAWLKAMAWDLRSNFEDEPRPRRRAAAGGRGPRPGPAGSTPATPPTSPPRSCPTAPTRRGGLPSTPRRRRPPGRARRRRWPRTRPGRRRRPGTPPATTRHPAPPTTPCRPPPPPRSPAAPRHSTRCPRRSAPATGSARTPSSSPGTTPSPAPRSSPTTRT